MLTEGPFVEGGPFSAGVLWPFERLPSAFSESPLSFRLFSFPLTDKNLWCARRGRQNPLMPVGIMNDEVAKLPLSEGHNAALNRKAFRTAAVAEEEEGEAAAEPGAL